jgi:hypothetical protein
MLSLEYYAFKRIQKALLTPYIVLGWLITLVTLVGTAYQLSMERVNLALILAAMTMYFTAAQPTLRNGGSMGNPGPACVAHFKASRASLRPHGLHATESSFGWSLPRFLTTNFVSSPVKMITSSVYCTRGCMRCGRLQSRVDMALVMTRLTAPALPSRPSLSPGRPARSPRATPASSSSPLQLVAWSSCATTG